MDVKQRVVMFEDKGGCVEEVNMSGPNMVAILCPMCREGNDAAKALEIT